MNIIVVVLILVSLIVSFILAWRSLSDLEVPEEARRVIRNIRPKIEASGIFLFFRDKILHYPNQKKEFTPLNTPSGRIYEEPSAVSSSGETSSSPKVSSSNEDTSDFPRP